MALIVRKYGGSSVATTDRIKSIAQQIKSIVQDGNQVVVVVSAMGKTTDQLINLAAEITNKPDKRELDMLLSIGERQSISLVALALDDIGVPAVSFTGSQVGIITDNRHGDAQILEIKADRIQQALADNKVVVIAGYQGVSTKKEITTLGRGGTDTTAVAIAARLNADRCELMKDVDGLFAVPPKLIQDAHLRGSVSYDEMLDIAEAGTELIAKNALRIAKDHSIKLSIGNTFTNQQGSEIVTKSSHEKGISQIISTTCLIKNERPKSTGLYQKIVQINDSIIVIDLNPDLKDKNALLVTLIGNQLSHQMDHFEKLLNIDGLYASITDSKIELLFNIQKENVVNLELKEIVKLIKS